MIGSESSNSEDDVYYHQLNIKQSSQGSESRQRNTKYFKTESYDLPGLIIFWQNFSFTTPFEGNMLPCKWGKNLTRV